MLCKEKWDSYKPTKSFYTTCQKYVNLRAYLHSLCHTPCVVNNKTEDKRPTFYLLFIHRNCVVSICLV